MFFFDKHRFSCTSRNVIFLLLFFSSWAFPVSLHEDRIIAQGGAVVYGDILLDKSTVGQPIIYVSKGATLFNDGAVSNAVIIEESKISKVKKSKKYIPNKKNHKYTKVRKPLKKVKVNTFYKNSLEVFHIAKIDDTNFSLVTSFSYSGRAAILSTFIFVITAVFYSSILNRYRYNVCFCRHLSKSFRIRPPPSLFLKYS